MATDRKLTRQEQQKQRARDKEQAKQSLRTFLSGLKEQKLTYTVQYVASSQFKNENGSESKNFANIHGFSVTIYIGETLDQLEGGYPCKIFMDGVPDILFYVDVVDYNKHEVLKKPSSNKPVTEEVKALQKEFISIKEEAENPDNIEDCISKISKFNQNLIESQHNDVMSDADREAFAVMQKEVQELGAKMLKVQSYISSLKKELVAAEEEAQKIEAESQAKISLSQKEKDSQREDFMKKISIIKQKFISKIEVEVRSMSSFLSGIALDLVAEAFILRDVKFAFNEAEDSSAILRCINELEQYKSGEKFKPSLEFIAEADKILASMRLTLGKIIEFEEKILTIENDMEFEVKVEEFRNQLKVNDHLAHARIYAIVDGCAVDKVFARQEVQRKKVEPFKSKLEQIKKDLIVKPMQLSDDEVIDKVLNIGSQVVDLISGDDASAEDASIGSFVGEIELKIKEEQDPLVKKELTKISNEAKTLLLIKKLELIECRVGLVLKDDLDIEDSLIEEMKEFFTELNADKELFEDFPNSMRQLLDVEERAKNVQKRMHKKQAEKNQRIIVEFKAKLESIKQREFLAGSIDDFIVEISAVISTPDKEPVEAELSKIKEEAIAEKNRLFIAGLQEELVSIQNESFFSASIDDFISRISAAMSEPENEAVKAELNQILANAVIEKEKMLDKFRDELASIKIMPSSEALVDGIFSSAPIDAFILKITEEISKPENVLVKDKLIKIKSEAEVLKVIHPYQEEFDAIQRDVIAAMDAEPSNAAEIVGRIDAYARKISEKTKFNHYGSNDVALGLRIGFGVLQRKVEILKSNLKKYMSEKPRLSKFQSELESKISLQNRSTLLQEKEAEYKKTEEEFKISEADNQLLKSKYPALSNERIANDRDVKENSERIAENIASKESLNALIVSKTAAIDVVAGEIAKGEGQIALVIDEIAKLGQNISDKEKKISDKEKEISDKEKEILDKDEKISDIEKYFEAMNDIGAKLKSKERDKAALEAEKSRNQEEVMAIDLEIEAIDENALKRKIEDTKAKITNLESERDSKDKVSLEAEIEVALQAIDTLTEKHAIFSESTLRIIIRPWLWAKAFFGQYKPMEKALVDAKRKLNELNLRNDRPISKEEIEEIVGLFKDDVMPPNEPLSSKEQERIRAVQHAIEDVHQKYTTSVGDSSAELRQAEAEKEALELQLGESPSNIDKLREKRIAIIERNRTIREQLEILYGSSDKGDGEIKVLEKQFECSKVELTKKLNEIIESDVAIERHLSLAIQENSTCKKTTEEAIARVQSEKARLLEEVKETTETKLRCEAEKSKCDSELKGFREEKVILEKEKAELQQQYTGFVAKEIQLYDEANLFSAKEKAISEDIAKSKVDVSSSNLKTETLERRCDELKEEVEALNSQLLPRLAELPSIENDIESLKRQTLEGQGILDAAKSAIQNPVVDSSALEADILLQNESKTNDHHRSSRSFSVGSFVPESEDANPILKRSQSVNDLKQFGTSVLSTHLSSSEAGPSSLGKASEKDTPALSNVDIYEGEFNSPASEDVAQSKQANQPASKVEAVVTSNLEALSPNVQEQRGPSVRRTPRPRHITFDEDGIQIKRTAQMPVSSSTYSHEPVAVSEPFRLFVIPSSSLVFMKDGSIKGNAIVLANDNIAYFVIDGRFVKNSDGTEKSVRISARQAVALCEKGQLAPVQITSHIGVCSLIEEAAERGGYKLDYDSAAQRLAERIAYEQRKKQEETEQAKQKVEDAALKGAEVRELMRKSSMEAMLQKEREEKVRTEVIIKQEEAENKKKQEEQQKKESEPKERRSLENSFTDKLTELREQQAKERKENEERRAEELSALKTFGALTLHAVAETSRTMSPQETALNSIKGLIIPVSQLLRQIKSLSLRGDLEHSQVQFNTQLEQILENLNRLSQTHNPDAGYLLKCLRRIQADIEVMKDEFENHKKLSFDACIESLNQCIAASEVWANAYGYVDNFDKQDISDIGVYHREIASSPKPEHKIAVMTNEEKAEELKRQIAVQEAKIKKLSNVLEESQKRRKARYQHYIPAILFKLERIRGALRKANETMPGAELVSIAALKHLAYRVEKLNPDANNVDAFLAELKAIRVEMIGLKEKIKNSRPFIDTDVRYTTVFKDFDRFFDIVPDELVPKSEERAFVRNYNGLPELEIEGKALKQAIQEKKNLEHERNAILTPNSAKADAMLQKARKAREKGRDNSAGNLVACRSAMLSPPPSRERSLISPSLSKRLGADW